MWATQTRAEPEDGCLGEHDREKGAGLVGDEWIG